MRGLKQCLLFVPLFALGACTALPDWSKPEFLYGEAFSEAKKKAGEGLKTDLPAVSISEVEGGVEKDTLTRVFKELSGDMENRNHADQSLRGGGSVELPEEPQTLNDTTNNMPSKSDPASSKVNEESGATKKSVFKGLSGDF